MEGLQPFGFGYGHQLEGYLLLPTKIQQVFQGSQRLEVALRLKAATIRDRLRDVNDINASSGSTANHGHLATVARLEYLIGFGEIAVR